MVQYVLPCTHADQAVVATLVTLGRLAAMIDKWLDETGDTDA